MVQWQRAGREVAEEWDGWAGSCFDHTTRGGTDGGCMGDECGRDACNVREALTFEALLLLFELLELAGHAVRVMCVGIMFISGVGMCNRRKWQQTRDEQRSWTLDNKPVHMRQART